ncbi:MAG: hypothetical protein V4598_09655 [Bdellovibrionota bacterium]
MWRNKLSYLLLLGIIACGGDSGNSDEFDRQEEEVPEPELIQKIYRGDLKPINSLVENDVEGQVVLRLEDESFEVSIGARRVHSSAHRLEVRTGKSCPSSTDDKDADGFISAAEANAVSGAVYIPLDSDLDNLLQDNGRYPTGGFLNAFGYQEDTERTNLVNSLGAESGIDFSNRVIMVLGTDPDDELPPTVASPDGRIPQETLPIACAELTQVSGNDIR